MKGWDSGAIVCRYLLSDIYSSHHITSLGNLLRLQLLRDPSVRFAGELNTCPMTDDAMTYLPPFIQLSYINSGTVVTSLSPSLLYPLLT